MELAAFLQQLQANGTLAAIRDNSAAQFGTPAQPYLGATLLPERIVPQNLFKEGNIRYRTVVANAGTRYSPVQIKSAGRLVGEFTVELSNSDIGLEMDSADYDAVLDLLGRQNNLDSAANVVMNLTDRAIAGLAMHNERMRWQAIVDAAVDLVGDNGYSETVSYPDAADTRVAVGDDWTDNTYDPYADILERTSYLAGKGYRVTRIIASTKVGAILGANEQIKGRFAPIARVVDSTVYTGRLTAQGISAGLQADGLPPIELYDALWFDQETSGRMLSDEVMVFIGATDNNVVIPVADGDTVQLANTLGYTAIGRAAGQQNPGRALRVAANESKPPSVQIESWQTSLPVIQNPEALAILSGIGV